MASGRRFDGRRDIPSKIGPRATEAQTNSLAMPEKQLVDELRIRQVRDVKLKRWR